MIIVSQDKYMIVNFERTRNIWIDDNALDTTDNTFDIVADDATIASYTTEERAKEIIAQIVELYEKCQIVVDERNRLVNYAQKPKVYEMPKE